ncbi:MAG: hypothetical protein A3J38_07530 [Gammaproteobacteria bacterium RIFCSPHIGHO2_12_FULL_45_9]|nr:MAG: hypothetical protein A3J38_07530 [Gammaproteobacteria bacterium RIFCSPHIGHO2_12_FULL_45_9]
MKWQTKKIGDVCDLLTGGTPSKSKPDYFNGGKIKWLVSGDIHQKEIFDCKGRITELGLNNSNAKFLPENSVMIALNGQGKTRGSVALLRTKAVCNQSLVSISPKNKTQLLPEYLYANLHGRYEEIRGLTGDGGNDRRGLNMPLIRSIEIPLPPIQEQKRIVAILDKAFANIEKIRANTEKNLKNARELFESYLQQVFSQGGEGWVQEGMENLFKIKHGFAFKGEDFTTDFDGNDPIVLTPGNYHENGGLYFVEKNTKRYHTKYPIEFLFKKGDLTIVMTDLSSKMKILGKPAIIEADNILHNQRIGKFEFLSKKVDKLFLYYFLMSNKFLNNIRSTATGTMVRHTAPNRILANLITYPTSLYQQKIIVESVEEIGRNLDRIKDIYETKLKDIDKLKKSLLHQAFTGQLTKNEVAA